MEIILEFILSFFSALFEIFFEVMAQVVFELLAELGVRRISEPFRRPQPVHPVLAGIGYLMLGAIAGALSILLLPKIFELPRLLRVVNLVVTPVACGYFMALVGSLRKSRGKDPIRLDTFVYGFVFALSMAFVRFVWR